MCLVLVCLLVCGYLLIEDLLGMGKIIFSYVLVWVFGFSF